LICLLSAFSGVSAGIRPDFICALACNAYLGCMRVTGGQGPNCTLPPPMCQCIKN